jgi:hypothetical protein
MEAPLTNSLLPPVRLSCIDLTENHYLKIVFFRLQIRSQPYTESDYCESSAYKLILL